MKYITWEKATEMLNIGLAKALACFCVTLGILYHHQLHVQNSTDPCYWLITSNRSFSDAPVTSRPCQFHLYTKQEALQCFQDKVKVTGRPSRFVVVGDSVMRGLFCSLYLFLTNDNEERVDYICNQRRHFEKHYVDEENGLMLDFYWQPRYNESMYYQYEYFVKSWLEDKNAVAPDFVFTSAFLWILRDFHGQPDALKFYRGNLTRLLPKIKQFDKQRTRFVWKFQEHLDPERQENCQIKKKWCNNTAVDEFNEFLDSYIPHTAEGLSLWNSFHRVTGLYEDYSWDGMHLSTYVDRRGVQVILNNHCNPKMNQKDGICCKNNYTMSIVQFVFIALLLLSIGVSLGVFLFYTFRLKYSNKNGAVDEENLLYPPIKSEERIGCSYVYLIRLFIIVAYLYLCDRYSFFMKVESQFSWIGTGVAFGIMVILGVSTSVKTEKDPTVNKVQCNEWMGWTQLAILVLWATGSSDIPQVQLWEDILYLAYLFIIGYQHFMDCYEAQLFSIQRLCYVIFRYNFFAVVCSLALNQSYFSYHLVPRITLFLIVLHLLFGIYLKYIRTKQEETKSQRHLFLLLLVMFTVMYLLKKLITKSMLRYYIDPRDDDNPTLQDPFESRLGVSLYAPALGAAFALTMKAIETKLKENKCTNENPRSCMDIPALLTALLGTILALAISTSECSYLGPLQAACPYTLLIPVTTLWFFRNVFTFLRERHSVFFTWCGDISIELLVAGCHTVLTDRPHSILTLVPASQTLNSLVILFITICIAHDMRTITEKLQSYFFLT